MQYNSDFVDIICSDLKDYLQQASVDRVLLFPAIQSRYRFLIHQTVAGFPNLASFSVGEGLHRQTVVCFKRALQRGPKGVELLQSGPAGQASKRQGRGRGMNDGSSSPSSALGTLKPQVSPARCTSLAEERQRKYLSGRGRARNKKPEQQLYVPKGRREVNQGRPVNLGHEETNLVTTGTGNEINTLTAIDKEQFADVAFHASSDQKSFLPDSLSVLSSQLIGRKECSGLTKDILIPVESPMAKKTMPKVNVKLGNAVCKTKQDQVEKKLQNPKRRQKQGEIASKAEMENVHASPSHGQLNNDVDASGRHQRTDSLNTEPGNIYDVRTGAHKHLNVASQEVDVVNKVTAVQFTHQSEQLDSTSAVCSEGVTDNWEMGCDRHMVFHGNLDAISTALNEESLCSQPVDSISGDSFLIGSSMICNDISEEAEILTESVGERSTAGDSSAGNDSAVLAAPCDTGSLPSPPGDNICVPFSDLTSTDVPDSADCGVGTVHLAEYEPSDISVIPNHLVDSTIEILKTCSLIDNISNIAPSEIMGNLAEFCDNSNSARCNVTALNTSTDEVQLCNSFENSIMNSDAECGFEEKEAKGGDIELGETSNAGNQYCEKDGDSAHIESFGSEQIADTNSISSKVNINEKGDNETGISQNITAGKMDDVELVHGTNGVGSLLSTSVENTINCTVDSKSEKRGGISSEQTDDVVDADSWDAIFDDEGECLNPDAMKELEAHVGKVEICHPKKDKRINYLDYQPKEMDEDMTAYCHVIEICDFPAEFLTRDIMFAFKDYLDRGFDIKWVDDTHALGVFSSSVAAQDALRMVHPMMKLKPLSEASSQSRSKVRRCKEFLQPYKARPETSAAAARRLVTGALGLTPRLSKEQRDHERSVLNKAKEKKRQDRIQKESMWDGNMGKCAMDAL